MSDLLATITLEVVPFHAYAPFPVILPFLNASWKSCSVRMCSTPCDCASITTVESKWRTQFYLQSGKQKSKLGGGRQPCCFWSKIPSEKGSERLRCHDATASSFVTKVRGEAFVHFHTVTVICRIDCLACRDEFFVNNPLDVKENVDHAHLSRLFWSALNQPYHSNTHVQLKLSFLKACLIIARVSVALSPRSAQNLMLLHLSDPLQNHINPITPIKRR
jgi:hypothetical protein